MAFCRKWRSVTSNRKLLASVGLVLVAVAVVLAAASYPTSVKSFSTRINGQTIDASWFNELQDEVVSIEGGLINGLAHDLKFTDASYDIGKSGATRPRDGFFSRNVTIGGTLTAPVAYPTVATTTSTGSQNNFDPGISGNTIIRVNSATDLTITGLVAGTAGQRLLIYSVFDGGGNVILVNESASSTASGRIKNGVTGSLIFTAGSTGGMAELVYDSGYSRWVVTTFRQGSWITPTFAAGDYTASSGTWTVDSADITSTGSVAYFLNGRQLTVALAVENTDVSATPTQLRRVIPGGFTAAKTWSSAGYGTDAGGTREGIVWGVSAAGTIVVAELLDATAWATTSSDNTNIHYVATFEVQ